MNKRKIQELIVKGFVVGIGVGFGLTGIMLSKLILRGGLLHMISSAFVIGFICSRIHMTFKNKEFINKTIDNTFYIKGSEFGEYRDIAEEMGKIMARHSQETLSKEKHGLMIGECYNSINNDINRVIELQSSIQEVLDGYRNRDNEDMVKVGLEVAKMNYHLMKGLMEVRENFVKMVVEEGIVPLEELAMETDKE